MKAISILGLTIMTSSGYNKLKSELQASKDKSAKLQCQIDEQCKQMGNMLSKISMQRDQIDRAYAQVDKTAAEYQKMKARAMSAEQTLRHIEAEAERSQAKAEQIRQKLGL